MTEKQKLTPKQAKFVEEYLVDLCAKDAAIKAGYSKKTAHVIGPENLAKPAIAAAIKELRDKQSEKTGLTIELLDRELLEMLKTCKSIPVDIDGIEVGKKYEHNGVGKALDMIGKRLNAFTHTVDLKNTDGSLQILNNAKSKLIGTEIPESTD